MSAPTLRRAAVLAAAALFLVACSGREERIESHLGKGRSLLAQAEYDKAMLEVRNVLQMDPRSAQAIYLGGQIDEGRGELQKAYSAYTKAVELKPDLYDAKAGIARLELSVNDNDKAAKIVDEVLGKDPKNVQALILKATLLARHGDTEAAIATINGAGKPETLPAVGSLLLVQLYVNARHDVNGAQAILTSALAAQPKEVSLLMNDAELAVYRHDDAAAVALFKRAADAAPNNPKVWSAWVAYLDRNGKTDDAEAVLRQSVEAEPDDSMRYLTLDRYLNDHRDPQVALAELQKQAKQRPHDGPIQFGLADQYRNVGDVDAGTEQLEAIALREHNNDAGQRARDDLANLDLEAGRDASARKRLDDSLKVNPQDGVALALRGRMELKANQLDASINDLRAASKASPDSPVVLASLAAAYRANNQSDLARDTLADAARLYPGKPEIGLLLCQYYVARDQADDGVKALDEVIRQNPRYLKAYEMKANLQLRAKDLVGAESTLKQLDTQFPNNTIGPMHLGEFYANQGKTASALAEFDRAAGIAPNAAEPRSAVIGVLMKDQRWVDAEARIDQMLKQDANSAIAYGLRGDVEAARNNLPASQLAYRHAIELAPRFPMAYIALARTYAKAKDVDGALGVLDEGVKAVPRDSSMQMAAAQLLDANGRHDDAIARYDAVLKHDPSNTLAANDLAMLLSDTKRDPESVKRALALTRRFEYSSDPSLLDTLGWTQYRAGQLADAVEVLRRAEALSPNTPILELHYGLALYKNGDVEGARQHLRLATASKQSLPDIEEARKIVGEG